MNKERFFELTTLHLSEEISETEKRELEQLLENESYKNEFDSICAKWKNSTRDKNLFNPEEGIERLTEKLIENDHNFTWPSPSINHIQSSNHPIILKYAAAILIFFTASFLTYYYILSLGESAEIDWNQKITALGDRSVINYSDGTRITLNSNSNLRYPAEFGDYKREIYLDGEAYFEVAPDSTKPFLVHSGLVTTEVLGTKFNVSAFSDEDKIRVSLVEGQVKVENPDSGKGQVESILSQNFQITYDITNNTSKIEKFDSLEIIGWRRNVLVFNDESLSTVFNKLERAYGVQFELKDSLNGSIKLTANFNNENFWTVATVIKKVTKLEYQTFEVDNKLSKIVFSK